MSSNADALAWERKWGDVVRRVAASPGAARERAALGQRHLTRAREFLRLEDHDQALISAETALVNAADALLQRDGYRLGGQTGSHEARFEYPLLPRIFDAHHDLITRARRARNIAQYEVAGRVSRGEAERLIELAERAIRDVLAILP